MHDGSSREMSTVDVTLSIRGRFDLQLHQGAPRDHLPQEQGVAIAEIEFRGNSISPPFRDRLAAGSSRHRF
jgi:hypothetical protein